MDRKTSTLIQGGASRVRRVVVPRHIVLLLLVVGPLIAGALESNAAGADGEYVCAARSDLVGRCFAVRGRLSFWNGAPSARIWPVGTKRLLGVHADVLPPTLAPSHSFDTELWARFIVCPFTPSRPGRMQFVCIESWHDLTVGQRSR